MKKFFFLGLLTAIMPNICMAESVRVTNLIREKQRKIEELEKCMGSTKGLQIAGLSTLGLTAAGIAANIAEAEKIDDYITASKKADMQIAIDTQKKEAKEKEIAGQASKKEDSAKSKQVNSAEIKTLPNGDIYMDIQTNIPQVQYPVETKKKLDLKPVDPKPVIQDVTDQNSVWKSNVQNLFENENKD